MNIIFKYIGITLYAISLLMQILYLILHVKIIGIIGWLFLMIASVFMLIRLIIKK